MIDHSSITPAAHTHAHTNGRLAEIVGQVKVRRMDGWMQFISSSLSIWPVRAGEPASKLAVVTNGFPARWAELNAKYKIPGWSSNVEQVGDVYFRLM